MSVGWAGNGVSKRGSRWPGGAQECHRISANNEREALQEYRFCGTHNTSTLWPVGCQVH